MFFQGIYRHYKGNLYEALCLVSNSNNGMNERVEVFYSGLQLEASQEGLRHHFRSLDEWSEVVCGESSCPDYGDPSFGEGTCVTDHAVPRFKYLGPAFALWMLNASKDSR